MSEFGPEWVQLRDSGSNLLVYWVIVSNHIPRVRDCCGASNTVDDALVVTINCDVGIVVVDNRVLG